ncbi:MAG TPA: ATP-binding protein [Candidatus Polarisedimenticolia bacterium]|nr:ATP-binding protein [Candidatus Polarisedimenticolia bacterium]
MASGFQSQGSARPKAWLAWSSGKDSAWALQTARQDGDYDVAALLTTVNRTHSRVAMHAVRESLLEMQAAAAGLPLVKVPIPSPCPNEVYEQAMSDAMTRASGEGVRHIIFGDLFLEDVRAYREKQLARCGMTPVFPLWGRDTRQLAQEMVAGGLCAYLTCVDPRRLDPVFAGRRFDEKLLADLPRGVDPCGENGEFHTFASAGPMFRSMLPITVGEIVERDGFMFADLLPQAAELPPSSRSNQPQTSESSRRARTTSMRAASGI